MKTLKIALFLLIGLTANAQSTDKRCSRKDSTDCSTTTYLAVEVDPAPFILGGYSFSLKFSPAKLKHVTLMGSIYSSDFPDKMMSDQNYENGFRNMKIKTSSALFADYFLKDNRTGFHFGPSVFFYNKSVEHASSGEVANFNSFYPNLRAGYVFAPFKNCGLYLNPWINFGKEIVVGNEASINDSEFTSEDFSYIVALHVGYRLFK